MPTCTLVIRDQVNVRFVGLDPLTRRKLCEELKFLNPRARHTPAFKLGRWDGKIAFCSVGGATYLNLLDRALPVVLAAGYEIDIDDQRPEQVFRFPEVDTQLVADCHWPADHALAGQPILLRDHQVQALRTYFANPQALQSLTTAFGKTIVVACMSRCVEPYGRSLIIVPNKSLIKQTERDYRALGLDVGVFYGERKEWDHKHTIATWQSLAVYAKKDRRDEVEIPIEDFLRGMVCVIVDECHTLKGPELRELLCGPLAHLPLRWGLTGTIPKEEFEFMSLLATVGPVVGEVRALTLQNKGILAHCDVETLQLDDSHVEFRDYAQEYRFLTTDRTRLEWVAGYCTKLAASGNTLILVDRIETGETLKFLIPGAVFVHGGTKTKTREAIYAEVATADNKPIIATYGVAAVGIDMPRLFNIVLLESGKSFIRVIQSIGRILRRAHDKQRGLVVDLCSNLKFSRKHLTKRKEYYRDAGYPYTVTKVDYRAAAKKSDSHIEMTL